MKKQTLDPIWPNFTKSNSLQTYPKTLWDAYLDLEVAGTLHSGHIRTPYSLGGCGRPTVIL